MRGVVGSPVSHGPVPVGIVSSAVVDQLKPDDTVTVVQELVFEESMVFRFRCLTYRLNLQSVHFGPRPVRVNVESTAPLY